MSMSLEDVVGLAEYVCLRCIIGVRFATAISITAVVAAAIMIPIVVRFIIVTTNK